MACVAYDSENVYIINRSSSSSGGLQYYTLPLASSSGSSGSTENGPTDPTRERPTISVQSLSATGYTDFHPNGGCGFYGSHLYITGNATSSSSSTIAFADIDIGSLADRRFTITPLPFSNPISVAKVTLSGNTECFAFADTGIRTYCTGSAEGVGVATNGMRGTLTNILSHENGVRLLALLEEGLAFDYNVSGGTLSSYNELTNGAASQHLPKGNIVTYKTSSSGVEALLVPEGNQPYLIHMMSDGSNITYTNRSIPVSSSGLGIYLAVNTNDTQATNPPIYVVSQQSEGSFERHTLTLDSFPLASDSGSDPGSTSTDTGGSDGTNNNDTSTGAKNNAGAIAGGVIGGIVGLALIIGALVFFLRKRRKARQPEFESIGEKSATSTTGWNFKASSIKQIQETQSLSNVRNVTVSPAELEALEPASPLAGGAVVLGGVYQFTRDPPVFADETRSRIPTYATRGIVQQSTGESYTLHYFTQSAQGAFLRSVNTTCAINSPRVIKHRDAIALSQSTQRSGYQYLWITEPCIPNQSLHNAFIGKDKNVDLDDYPFKAWSTYALLESVKDIHAAKFVHLGLTPSCFFYADPEDSISDWQVTGFDQAHSAGERLTEARLSQWSAPELFSTASSDNRRCFRQTVQQTSDIWSLGCIIYTLATGRNLTIDLNHTAELSRRDRDQLYIRVTSACNEAGTVNESFRTLLEGMLQPDPSRRSTAEHLAAYWKEANGLYDDDEEENNEAEESVASP